MEDTRPSDAALAVLLLEIEQDRYRDLPEPACARCLREGCEDWCDGHEPIDHPTKSVTLRQKEWECAHAWLEAAEYEIWILEIARMPRSGRVGRMIMDGARAWRDHCARDEQRAWRALYGKTAARHYLR